MFDVSALASRSTGGCGSYEAHQPQASSAPISGLPNIEKPDTPKPTASREDTIGNSDPAVTKPIIQTAASERSRRRKAEWLNMFGMRGELRPSRQASVVSSSHHSLPDVLHDSIYCGHRPAIPEESRVRPFTASVMRSQIRIYVDVLGACREYPLLSQFENKQQ